jgi:MFS family permease
MREVASALRRRVVGAWARTFRSLHQRNYRAYFVGQAFSVVGTWMQRIGQDWLVLQITDSPLALGVSLLCQFLPMLVGGVWAGVVIDRVDTRRLILLTQAVQALLAAGLAVLALTGTVTLLAVYALALGLGIVSTFDVPARHAFVPELVGDDDIVNAQALNSLVNNVGRLLGPAVAGLLIVVAGVGVTFVANAVSFAAVLIGLLVMDTSALRRASVVARAPGQARAGLQYVWRQQQLRAALVLVALASVFGQNFRVVFPLLAADVFSGGPDVYGLLTAVMGLGAVAGGLVVASAVHTSSRLLVVVYVLFSVTNIVLGVAPTLAVAIGVVLVLGATNIAVNSVARSLMQVDTAPGMRGRVMAIYSLVFLGGTPIGGPLLGLLCEVLGVRTAQALSGVVCLAGTAIVAPRLCRRGADPVTKSMVDAEGSATADGDK